MKRGGVGLDGRDKEEASRFGNRRHHLNGSTEARTLKGGGVGIDGRFEGEASRFGYHQQRLNGSTEE